MAGGRSISVVVSLATLSTIAFVFIYYDRYIEPYGFASNL